MKKQLITLLLLIVCGYIQAQTAVPLKGIVASYPFNGNAEDDSPNNNHGVVNGAVLTTDRFGTANSAYQFDGVSSYIEIPTNPTLNLTDSLSISMWVYLAEDNINGGHHLIVKGATGEYSMAIHKLTKAWGLNKQGIQAYVLGANPFTDSVWTHVVATYKYPTAKLYINGILDNTGTASSKITASNTSLYIGTILPAASGSVVKGKLDDIVIYNRVLTDTEISNLYNSNTCNTSVVDTLRIPSTTGINNFPPSFGLVKLYPNPTKDNLIIDVSNPSGNYTLKILNSSATVVYSSILSSASTSVAINTLGNSGLYFVQIINSANTIVDTKKIVLE